MLDVIFDFLLKWMIIFLTGIVIKLMDDYLDQELDKIEGKFTLAVILDKAIVPYSLLSMVFCMMIYPNLAGSLFLASYIIGMGSNLKQRLPLGLNAFQEFVIFGILGLIIFGFIEMLSSLVIIIFIQFVDDFLDFYSDAKFTRRNFVIRFGFLESVIITLICLIASLILDWEKAVLVSISTPLILYILNQWRKWIKDA